MDIHIFCCNPKKVFLDLFLVFVQSRAQRFQKKSKTQVYFLYLSWELPGAHSRNSNSDNASSGLAIMMTSGHVKESPEDSSSQRQYGILHQQILYIAQKDDENL